MPRSVVAVVFAPSVIVLSTKDPPRLPSPRSSLMIVASGEQWTMTMTARPRRASRTSTASLRLLCAHPPCSSPSSLLSSSSSQNALPKLVEDDLQEIARLPPASTSVSSSSSVATPLPSLPSRSSRPMNNAPMSVPGIDVVVVAILRRRHATAPSLQRSSGGGSRPPGGGGSRSRGVGGWCRRICRTPPPPSLPTPPPTRYRNNS